jgi:hypothetical protein
MLAVHLNLLYKKYIINLNIFIDIIFFYLQTKNCNYVIKDI